MSISHSHSLPLLLLSTVGNPLPRPSGGPVPTSGSSVYYHPSINLQPSSPNFLTQTPLRKFIIANLTFLPQLLFIYPPPYIATATTPPSETAVLLFFHFFFLRDHRGQTRDRPPPCRSSSQFPPSVYLPSLSLPTRAGALSYSSWPGVTIRRLSSLPDHGAGASALQRSQARQGLRTQG